MTRPRVLPPLEAEPTLEEMLAEAGQDVRTSTPRKTSEPAKVAPPEIRPSAGPREAEIAWAAVQACDAAEIPDGPLLWRLAILTERQHARTSRGRGR